MSRFTQYTHTATVVARLHYSRREAVNVGEFEEQDAAVVQAWHERDVQDTEYHAHRLTEWRHRNADRAVEVVDTVVHRDDTACLLYTSPSPRDKRQSRMPSSA